MLPDLGMLPESDEESTNNRGTILLDQYHNDLGKGAVLERILSRRHTWLVRMSYYLK